MNKVCLGESHRMLEPGPEGYFVTRLEAIVPVLSALVYLYTSEQLFSQERLRYVTSKSIMMLP
jgi:hypothetical protein